MPNATCTTRAVRIGDRPLHIARLDAKVRVRFDDIGPLKPTSARVRVTRETTAWTTPGVLVKMIIGSQLVDFDTPVSVAAPTADGAVIELPADEIERADGLAVMASATQAGALASVGFDLNYPADERAAGVIGAAGTA